MHQRHKNEQLTLVTELLHLFNIFHCQLEKILMNQAELTSALEAQAAAIEATKTQVDKVMAEVTSAAATQAAAIEALRQELANAVISPEAQAALDHITASNTALAAAVQGLDDLNPDAPVA